MNKLQLLGSCMILAALAAPAWAGDGAVYEGFGTDASYPGYGFYVNTVGGTTQNDTPGQVAAAPDGSLYLGGRMSAPGSLRISLVKTDASGYPDYGFADAGTRTYVSPCVGAFARDLKIDAQGRLWMLISGCGDFIVYRFLPSGDPDTALKGTGSVSIAFDKGGTNEDRAAQLLLLPGGGCVVAGWADSADHELLAVAQIDDQGDPAAFGVAGKVTVALELDAFFVQGLHRMDDGRLMIDGSISENAVAKHFVVRLQPGGGFDLSYGNLSPGISVKNFQTALNLVSQPVAKGSWMERDGSLIQIGSANYASAPNSDNDVLLVRWDADGQLDTSIGPFGTRHYSLDFAGPNPVDAANNSDSGENIVREGNGRYLISANSGGADGGTGISFLRLKPDLTLDTSFGTGGFVRHYLDLSASVDDGLVSFSHLLLRPGIAIVPTRIATGGTTTLQGMLGVQEDVLFADNFE